MQATLFGALGEPSRLRIVETLRTGPSSVGELVERLDLRQPQVSKHLRVLNEVGVVAVEPRARQRIYRLQPEPFEQIAHWVDSFEQLWEVRLDALGRFLASTDEEDDEHG